MVKLDGKRFDVDVSPETLQKTTFGSAKVSQRVNLERALRLSDRIDGHLVSGHIDGMGTLSQRKNLGNSIIVSVDVPEYLTRYMINKGSVAVDGISLTINACETKSFSVSIIPHTATVTTIEQKNEGDRVNIETDMIGKYVENFTSRSRRHIDENSSEPSGISEEFLIKTGFFD
jgi:riboflavin synthase